MRKVNYKIIDFEMLVIVNETKVQKDILGYLDEMLECAEDNGWDYTFSDDIFYIEYKDGSTYEAGPAGEYGKYKKKGISRIIWNNAFDTWVYGDYTINEWGCIS